jgi:hypothetical protein
MTTTEEEILEEEAAVDAVVTMTEEVVAAGLTTSVFEMTMEMEEGVAVATMEDVAAIKGGVAAAVEGKSSQLCC